MPFGDGTGPRGMGPMTGRGGGYCAGFNAPGFANPIPGRLGLGYGRGPGRAYGFPPRSRRYMPAFSYRRFGYPSFGRGFYGYPYF